MGAHLVIAVDGVPLDRLLHALFPSDGFLEGLVPTLLGWFMALEWEQRATWERILPEVGTTAIAPLLMGPDDLNLFCSLLVADVAVEPETVGWNRLGWDKEHREVPTFDSADELASVDLEGTTVEWLPGTGPYIFPRADYERCIQVFKREFETGVPYWGSFRSPTVYKSKTHLDFDPDELGAKLEPENGKYYFPRALDPDGVLELQFPVIAVRKEIGDAEVGVFTLRKKALEVLSDDSITARFLQHGYSVVEAERVVEQLDAIRWFVFLNYPRNFSCCETAPRRKQTRVGIRRGHGRTRQRGDTRR